jgi:uncharacterized caspase-like protein
LQLKYAANDAEKAVETLVKRGRLFKPGKVVLLTDNDATLSRIERAFETLPSAMAPSDVFVLYLSGHGRALEGRYHFLPQEFIYENDDVLRDKSLSEDRLAAFLKTIPATKTLVVIDTCHAGAALRLAALDLPAKGGYNEKSSIARLMAVTGRAVLAASSSRKVALEGYGSHGVFTYAFLQGLKGEADMDDGEITIDEMSGFLHKKVPALTKEKWKFEQFPMRSVRGHSFAIGWKE